MSKHLMAACAAAILLSPSGVAWFAQHDEIVIPRWTAEDSAALEARIVEIETRLYAHQARVMLWEELRDRHESVSAVACENLGEHAMAMAAGDSRFQAQVAQRNKRRLAAHYELEP